tara:strand:- start:539 stop:1351 length:813 start_codon:yes stop_codon:yes gene_type:complete
MGSKQKTATQTSTTDIPDWMKTGYVVPALDKAKGMLDDKFVSYTDDRFADKSEFTKDAMNKISGMTDMSLKDRSDYMNPFTSDVIDASNQIIKDETQSLNTDLLGRSYNLGADTNTRVGVAQGELASAAADAIADNTSKLKMAGYQQAGQDMLQDFNLGVSQADNLYKAGAVDQSFDQQQKDFDYSQFLGEQGQEAKNLNQLLAAIAGVPQTSVTTSQVPYTTNPLATAVGIGSKIMMPQMGFMQGTGGLSPFGLGTGGFNPFNPFQFGI